MAALESILKKARRRMLLNGALHRTAVGLLLGSAAGVLLLVVERTVGLSIPWVVYPIICAGSVAAGVIVALFAAPRLDQVAVRIDRSLRLKDRLGTGAAIDRGLVRETELAALARRDAERFAERIDVRPSAPIRVSRAWWGAGMAAIALAVAVLYLPRFAWARSGAPTLTPEERAELDERQTAASDTIDQVLDDLRQEDGRSLAAAEEDLEVLADLAEQLRRENLSPDEFTESRDRSSDQLNTLAEDFERQADRDEQSFEALTEQFSGLDSPEEGDGEPTLADELREALRRGEYDTAADLVERMERSLSEMTESERRSLAEAIRELSEQIEDTRAEDRAEQERRDEAVREALRDQGVDDDAIDDVLDHDDPEEIQRGLEEEGVDSDVARDLAEELDREQQRRDARDEADRESGEMSENLDQLADEIEQPETSPEGGDGEAPEEEMNPPDQPQEPNRPGEETQPPAGERQPGDEQKEGESTGQEQTEREQQEVGETGEKRTERETQPGGEPDDAQQQPGGREQGEQTDQPQESTPGEQSPGREGEQPGEGTDADAQREGAEQQPSDGESDQSAAERLQRQLDNLQQRGEGADDAREQSERLREAARRMAEQMTPEERRRFEEWAQQFDREGDERDAGGAGQGPEAGAGSAPLEQTPPPDEGDFSETETVDLRESDSESQKTIAEWLADERLEGDPLHTDRPGRSGVVGDARKAAERAVNNASVPARYHRLIQRYFGRFGEAMKEAAESGEPAPAGGAEQSDE